MTGFRATAALGTVLVIAGCDTSAVRTSPMPEVRPAAVRPAPPAPPASRSPSAESQDLAAYYGRLQADQLARGLLRTDGGGPDTHFDADRLARTFEQIAFFGELAGSAADGAELRLNRWQDPVRIALAFGPSVPAGQRGSDRDSVQRFAARLQRVTGHPISLSEGGANFLVLVGSVDDRAFLNDRISSFAPGIGAADRAQLTRLPRAQHCIVAPFQDAREISVIRRAVAVIRAEHPDLLRQACFHEEIAQGLGLVNDSPRARPSIFNDDDEFALLTTQDEFMLKMLYDPRLRVGMTLAEAQPIVRQIAAELLGEDVATGG